MKLQIDPLDNPPKTVPIQSRWNICIEPCLNWQFGVIHDLDRQFGNGSFPTQTRMQTQSDGPDLLLILW